ncbi:MAG: PQQ-binding-like beta-propeller repeat protein [Planctomycetota bacterium]
MLRRAAMAAAPCLAVLVLGPGRAGGADWPGWLGADRSGVLPEGALPERFPEGGPKLVWRADCSVGCSTPVVSGDRVVIMDHVDDSERILCFSREDGKRLWMVEYEETYKAGGKWGNGARSTPATDGERVYCYGVAGKLSCVTLESGTLLWRNAVCGEKPRLKGGYGAYSNPLLVGDLVIAMRHRRPALIAYDKHTGGGKWTALSTGAYFSTPMLAEVAGRRQIVACVREVGAGVDPNTGEVLWTHEHPRPVNAFLTPVVHRDLVAFRGYGIPYYAFRVRARGDGFETKTAWKSRDMQPRYNAPAARDGRLYVLNQGRSSHFVCAKMATGEVIWKHRIRRLGSRVSSWAILSGERVLLMIEDGRLILGRDAGDAFERLDAATILSKTAFAMPAVCAGRLYARDFDHVACYELFPEGERREGR